MSSTRYHAPCPVGLSLIKILRISSPRYSFCRSSFPVQGADKNSRASEGMELAVISGKRISSSFYDRLQLEFLSEGSSPKSSALQVEARLRQLEGKALASGAAQLGQKANQAVYNPQAQGVSAAIATTSKSYNPAADVTMNGLLEKKDKASHPALRGLDF